MRRSKSEGSRVLMLLVMSALYGRTCKQMYALDIQIKHHKFPELKQKINRLFVIEICLAVLKRLSIIRNVYFFTYSGRPYFSIKKRLCFCF